MVEMPAQLRLMVNPKHKHLEATELEDEAVVVEEEVRTDEDHDEVEEAIIMRLPQIQPHKISVLLLREPT